MVDDTYTATQSKPNILGHSSYTAYYFTQSNDPYI